MLPSTTLWSRLLEHRAAHRRETGRRRPRRIWRRTHQKTLRNADLRIRKGIYPYVFERHPAVLSNFPKKPRTAWRIVMDTLSVAHASRKITSQRILLGGKHKGQLEHSAI